MTRKALKNVPIPDEEKLRALYSTVSSREETAAPKQPSEPRPHIYKHTSKQENKKTSKQEEAPTPKQTSQHVYKNSSTQGNQYTPAPSPHVNEFTSGHSSPPAFTYSPPPIHPNTSPPPTRNSGTYSQPPEAQKQKESPYRRQTYHMRPDQIEWIRVDAFHSRRKISEVLRDIVDEHYANREGD